MMPGDMDIYMPGHDSSFMDIQYATPAFQEVVLEFVDDHHLEIEVPYRMLDLVSELGEVAKEVLKSSHYGITRFMPENRWEEELGDLFFSLICLANSTGVNLEEALNTVLQKYENRLISQENPGSGE
jgi:NTP pyrophosphatase (non-canonical NTP hydrolase)